MDFYFHYHLKRKIIYFALSLFVILNACQNEQELEITPDISSDPVNGQIIEGSYIVVLKEGSIDMGALRTSDDYLAKTRFMREAAGGMLQMHRISTQRIEQIYSSALHGFSANLDQEMLERLRHDERVAYIEPDRIITLGPPAGKGPNSGGGGSTIEETPYGITRVGGPADGTGKIAYIIDTGIDLTHPDLNVANYGFNAFTIGKDAESLNDGNGHGTHVAGTVAAKKDEKGVIGVAYGATVVPVKVLNSRGSGSYSGVIAGVDWVNNNGKSGEVANMSLGGPKSDALNNAVVEAAKKGIKFTIAAGNSSADANNYSPASANHANIYTISAMDSKDIWASFSNYKNPPIDYCAPGVSIKSTWKDGGYNTISGTSMAAPHAAGVLLLAAPKTSGYVKNDPDGTPDPIVSHK
jgi:subtilisin family serine protease